MFSKKIYNILEILLFYSKFMTDLSKKVSFMPSSNSVKFMLCNVRKPEQFTLRRPDGKEYSLTTEAATQVIDALLNTELPDMKSCLYPRKFGFLTAELSYGGVAGHGGDAM